MTPLQQLVHQHLPHLQPQFDRPLAPLSYFRIGGPAEVFLELDTREKIIEVVKFCAREKVPFRILAGASNVLISSAGVKGLTLSIANDTYEILKKTGDGASIRVGSGFRTALFVRQTIDDGLAGLEYYLGVPGKIGGAVFNNAHYSSHLIGEMVSQVEVISRTGDVRWVSQEECEFRYDFSRFHHSQEVILQIDFQLPFGDKATSMQLVKESTLLRAQSQPLGEPSSGCYFKNVPNTPELQQRFPQFTKRSEFPTAFLIDQLGLKGASVGGIKISEKHAAFFVNTGNGTSDEVKQLAARVKAKVKTEFGVELKEEVFWIE